MLWRKKKISSKQYRCSTCGQIHKEIPALGFMTPDNYDTLSEKDKTDLAEISEDFCVISYPDQTDRFIRTVLSISIHGTCETLDYGIWVSVSKESFEDYQENFKSETSEPIYFGRICNKIRDYSETTKGLHVNVQVRKGGIRPEILLHQTEHQLIKDWETGITIEEAEKRIEKAINNVG